MEAYAAYQAGTPQTAYGPQDIRGGDVFDLLVSWICDRYSDDDWGDILRRAPRRMLVRIGFAILHVRRPGRRFQGMKTVAACVAAMRMPGGGAMAIATEALRALWWQALRLLGWLTAWCLLAEVAEGIADAARKAALEAVANMTGLGRARMQVPDRGAWRTPPAAKQALEPAQTLDRFRSDGWDAMIGMAMDQATTPGWHLLADLVAARRIR